MTPADRARLIKLLGMLGSEHDGERAAAASAVVVLVKRLGLTWEGLVVGATSPNITAEANIQDAHQRAYNDAMRAQMEANVNRGAQGFNRAFTDVERAAMDAMINAARQGQSNYAPQGQTTKPSWSDIFGGKR